MQLHMQLNDMQMWSVWICMQSTNLIPIIQGWSCYIHHFHVRQKIWKAHLRGCGWNNFHSVVHCQYAVSYAYSRYVNGCLRGKKHITAGRAQDAPFPASTQDPLLVLLLRSSQLHLPSLSTAQRCRASRCSSSDANSYNFRIWMKVFFCVKAAKWQEATETASLFGSVREGELWTDSCFGEIRHSKNQRRRAGSSLFTTPVMRCSEQRRRTAGVLMATIRREDMCWEKDLGVVNKALSDTEDTLRTLKSPVC